MNKKELVEEISTKAGLSKTQVEKILKAFEDSVIGALSRGDKVTLVGFGTFGVSNRKARKGRNPQTGQEITIPAKKTPKFTAGKVLKEAVQ
jgi:DNA-binding protein HU-beta